MAVLGLLALLATSCSSAASSVPPAADSSAVGEMAVSDLPRPGPTQAPRTDEGDTNPIGTNPVTADPGQADAVPAAATIPVQSAPSLDTVQRQRRAAADEAQPVALSISSLAVDAPIRPVGVEPNGEMEIPGANDVGWYRFGSRPGEPGSAVLAAHVDFNGQIGVFYELASGEVGDEVDIRYSDGTTQTFVVVDRAQYEKSSLPFDEIFRRNGDPTLVLITCGGAFNPSLRSYEDNVVLYAEPV